MTKGTMHLSLTVNGASWEGDVSTNVTLLDFVRDTLQLTGAKKGCDEGACGACTVLVGTDAICSCLALAVEMDGKEIKTIEGLEKDGRLHPLQLAFVKDDALQCGFCTPGQVMSACSLVLSGKQVTRDDVKNFMSGNLCRCGCYNRINEAILEVANSTHH